MALVVLILSTVLFLAQVTTAAVKYPVVLVPGLLSSQLQFRLTVPLQACNNQLVLDWSTLFADPWWLTLPNCLTELIRFNYDATTHTSSSQPGVETRVPGFGDTSTIEWLTPGQVAGTNAFDKIVNNLVWNGYTRNVSVRGAPYDWRKAPNELDANGFHTSLQQLIESTYAANGNKPVVLVGHSMGGLNSLYLLKKMTYAWRCQYIKAFISLGTPWYGSVKAVHVVLSGLGVPNWGPVNATSLKIALQSFPSVAFLFPTSNSRLDSMPPTYPWMPDPRNLVIKSSTPAIQWTASTLGDMINAAGYSNFRKLYDDTRNIVQITPTPGVRYHCITGRGLDTEQRIDFAFPFAPPFPDGANPYIYSYDGDDTVNYWSLQGCLDMSPAYYNSWIDLNGVGHTAMLQDQRLVDYIVKVATGQQYDDPVC